jgi:2',3'-cyclic-nucleotide 2'-phosphodiesterase (5'-nucleotidase family)
MKFFDVLLVLLLCQNTFNQEKIVKVAILGTNDIHGVAFPTPLYRTDTN